MKALSSQATIVILKFTQPELQNILSNDNVNVTSVKDFEDIFKQMQSNGEL